MPSTIVNGGFDDGVNGWSTSETGGFTSPGSVSPEAGAAVLREGDSFLVTLSQTFIVPPNALTLSFRFAATPGFDLSSAFIPDAFEASLLTPANMSVVPVWMAGVTSFFNVQETGVVQQGPGIAWDGATATLDISSVPAGTEVTLYFDLIGGDFDTMSGVTVDDVVLMVDVPDPTVACCMSDGSCEDLSAPECIAAGGIPGLPDSTCATVPCAPPGPVPCWWNNGAADGQNALQSQTVGSFNARATDDFILEAGRWHLTQSIKVCMAVSVNVTSPVVQLEIYSDCNGKPGTRLTTLTMPEQTLLTPSPFPGFNLYSFEFEWETYQLGDPSGCTRFWISPVGRTTGGYFWPTSGNGNVQGAQGQFQSAALGYPDWTDGDQVVNFMRCTDFCFEVCAKSCYTIKDQGDYDLAGQASIKFPSVEGFDAAAADNFQITPARGPVDVCRVEAYLATNCDPTRVFGQIFANQCDLPGAVLYTLNDPVVIEQTGVFYDGLQVYCFRFDCPPNTVLNGGLNYWFSLSALSGGTIFDRAVFLYRARGGMCDGIHITGGAYKNSLIGVDTWTPVAESDLAGVARDFAFRIYGAARPGPAGSVTTGIPGDVNNDGRVDLQDVALMIFNWGRSAE